MDDYIFLIIAVVLSIFAALKKNKKKSNEDQPFVEKEERPRNFFMDQLLGEDFLEEPEEEVKPPVRLKPLVRKEAEVGTIPVSRSGIYHTQFKSTLPDRPKNNLQPSLKKSKIEEMDAEQEADDSPGYLEDFSLRKAFVYSEIMNRKYSTAPEY